MKKKSLFTLILLCSLITLSAASKGFWELYVSGPDFRSFLDAGDWGEWTIEDVNGDPIDSATEFYWWVQDDQARLEGYPASSLGRPLFDTDRVANAQLSFGSGFSELSAVTVTCRMTYNGVVNYESYIVTNDE